MRLLVRCYAMLLWQREEEDKMKVDKAQLREKEKGAEKSGQKKKAQRKEPNRTENEAMTKLRDKKKENAIEMSINRNLKRTAAAAARRLFNTTPTVLSQELGLLPSSRGLAHFRPDPPQVK